MSNHPSKRHGVLRGLENTLASSDHEGRFGRMFRTLRKADFSDDALSKLALAMVSTDTGPQTPENEVDDEENTGISAGYTYFGQFIDHDLTFDPASSLQKLNDPNALIDFRTPRFDLDNIYGRGPDDQPYLFEGDGMHFILGRDLTGSDLDKNTKDLQRNNPHSGEKRALIGDPRNDENVIVSQLQGIFLRFHNKMVDINPGKTFEEIQQLVRWHYQWVVIHDFLPKIIGADTYNTILPNVKAGKNIHEVPPHLKFFEFKKEAFIPVEFTAAAYRFGHSMIRPIYRLNQHIPRFLIFSSDPATSLTGFREFPSQWAIDWRLFFDFDNKPDPLSPQRIQPAYKIDTSLVNPLGDLPKSIAFNPSSLALRNLQRGRSMGLPSGQDVAKRMGIKPLTDNQLRVGKATEADTSKNPTLISLSPEFKDKAPLWFYVLAEAQQQFVNNSTPIHLGPVGGRIVGEVFIGLLLGDHHSYFHLDPNWKPLAQFQKDGEFKIRDLISAAIS